MERPNIDLGTRVTIGFGHPGGDYVETGTLVQWANGLVVLSGLDELSARKFACDADKVVYARWTSNGS